VIKVVIDVVIIADAVVVYCVSVVVVVVVVVVMVDGSVIVGTSVGVNDVLVNVCGIIVDDDPVVIRVVSVDSDVANVVMAVISGWFGVTLADFIPSPRATALIIKLIRQIHIMRIHRR
jgi:hypothetical protein